MPTDAGYLAYLTSAVYWALIIVWALILYYYAREYRRFRRLNPLIAGLLIVIFIDGTRTLIESLYFGTWYTARTGLVPPTLWELLSRPEYVIIPKGINLIAALIIIIVMVRQWFPAVKRETERHQEVQRLYEELRALEQLRDDLTHMIVHDLRTPLTSVIGTLETVCQSGLDEATRTQLLDDARGSASHLLDMVNSLLDVSRLESGELRLELTEFDICTVGHEAVAQVRPLAAERNVQVNAHVPAEPVRVRADRNMVWRILLNLLGNAVKFTPEGGSIDISCVSRPERHEVEVAVADTGPGISAEEQTRIFNKFMRGKAGEAVGPSLGLGLSFAKLAVEAHGGRVWVESQPGQGATFRFTLPLGAAPNDAG